MILLPSPSVDEVPRGQFRETLYSENYSASAVEFIHNLQEEEIRSELNKIYASKKFELEPLAMK